MKSEGYPQNLLYTDSFLYTGMVFCIRDFMQEESQNSPSTGGSEWSKMNKEKKIAFIALILCALFLFFYSGTRVLDGINAPFRGSVEELKKNKDMLKDPVAEEERLAKRVDTDGDGFSDWEETNVYHTSPYLWSTAGDDVPDNVKIALGANPLCKLGEKCTAASQVRMNLPSTTLPFVPEDESEVNQEVGSLIFGTSPAAQQLQGTAEQAGVDFNLRDQIPKDPAVLRKALLTSGKVTQEDLDKITDEQLLKMVDEAITEVEVNNGAATSTQ